MKVQINFHIAKVVIFSAFNTTSNRLRLRSSRVPVLSNVVGEYFNSVIHEHEAECDGEEKIIADEVTQVKYACTEVE